MAAIVWTRKIVGMIVDQMTQDAKLRPSRGRLRRCCAFLVLVAILIVAAWFGLFALDPGLRHDPRSPHYLLWKYCALPMPKDDAFATAMRDSDRERLVVGRTADELERRFGIVVRRTDDPNLTQHQQQYSGAANYAWLGDSWYIVEFRGGRAVSCRLMKG